MYAKLRLIASAITTITIFQGPAHAGVSDDLVFCSKLASPKERIACYDAAARIAANGSGVRASRTGASPTMVSAPAADTGTQPPPALATPERTSFRGGYAAIGGGFGVGSPRSFALPGAFSTVTDSISPHGWSSRGVAGVNAVVGNFLFGTEFAGRFGDEGANASIVSTPGSLGALFLLSGKAITSYSVKNDAGVHVAARVGVTFNDTLAFVRGGVGATHIRESATVDATGLFSCIAVSVSGACLSTLPGPLQGAVRSRWAPSAIVGAGLEHNFGPIFGRLEGEIETIASQQTPFVGLGSAGATSEPLWFARVMASIGVRF